MEEGIERRGRLARRPVAGPRGQRVGECPDHEEGERGEGRKGEFAAVVGHQGDDDPDLEDGDGALLDSVDQDTLHIGHVLDEAGHDVAGRPVVEPGEGKPLDPPVEIAPEVEDHPLLEMVVEQDAQRVEQILGKESCKAGQNQRQKLRRVMLAQHHVDHPRGDRGKDSNHQRSRDGTEHGRQSHPGIAGGVTEDTEQDANGQ